MHLNVNINCYCLYCNYCICVVLLFWGCGKNTDVVTELRRDMLYFVRLPVLFKLYDLNPHKWDILIMKC